MEFVRQNRIASFCGSSSVVSSPGVDIGKSMPNLDRMYRAVVSSVPYMASDDEDDESGDERSRMELIEAYRRMKESEKSSGSAA